MSTTVNAHASPVPLSRVALDVLLVVTLAAGLLSWLFDPLDVEWGWIKFRISWGARPVVAAILVTGLWWVVQRRTGRTGAPRLTHRLALGLGMTLLVVSALDGALGLAGIPRGEPVFAVHDNDGEAFRADGTMVHDPDVLWRFVPGNVFNGLTINQQGFVGRDFSPDKVPGTIRVSVMGDSCSAQGYPPYSDLLHDLLNEGRADSLSWDVINHAVHGYTVMQGRALYEKRVRDFSPDIVVLYFGWNSHWLTEQPDHLRMIRDRSPVVRALANGLAKKRITTWARRQLDPSPPERMLRVPPARYEETLSQWLAQMKDDGVHPIVLTAPRAERLTTALIHNRNVESVEKAEQLHDQYVEITRAIARLHQVQLVDLAADIPDVLRPQLFTRDGIHLTGGGHEWIAKRLARALADWPVVPGSELW